MSVSSGHSFYSRVNRFKAPLTLVLALGLGLGTAWLIESKTKSKTSLETRNPASTNEIFHTKSKLFRPDQKRVAKPNQLVDIWVSPVRGFPSEDSQEFELKADVTLSAPLDGDLSYEWVLPAGAEVVQGELKDELSGVLPGQTVQLFLTVVGFSSEGMPRNIVLNIGGTQKGVGVGSSAVFSSHPTRADLSIGFRSLKTGKALDGSVLTGSSKIEVEDLSESSTDHEPSTDDRPEAPKGAHF